MLDPVALERTERAQQIGDYQLVKELGRGGWGTVYKALHCGLGKMVALKLLHESTGTAVKRFDREIHMQARLRHPNIVPVFDTGIGPDQRPYLVMDYIEGQPLSKLIADKRLNDVSIARLIAKVGHALQHAHQRGILHRDIKPDNILVDRSGQPFVVDFGIARDTEDEGEALTRVGQVVGTPYYIAPEQIQGQALGPETDVWALGVVLYYALAGHPPFRGRNELDTLGEVMRSEPAKPERKGGPPVPADLWTICRHALEKDPLRRYRSAEAFATDLENLIRDEPLSVAPDGLWDQMKRWWRHRAWPVQAVAFTTLTAVSVGATTLGLLRALSGVVPAAAWPETSNLVWMWSAGAALVLSISGCLASKWLAPKRLVMNSSE